MANKTAKARPPKSSRKTAKTTPVLESSGADRPYFSFEYADRKSREDWCFPPAAEDAPEVFDFLCEMAQLTWREIERQMASGRRRHHDQAVGSICEPAQQQLASRKLGETFGDDIFRFRLSGEKRLWGFRQGRVFYIVWWDPNHQVYPTEKG